MNNLFKEGQKRQTVRIIPRESKKNNGWNSFSCPLNDVDLFSVEDKPIGSLNHNFENRKLNL